MNACFRKIRGGELYPDRPELGNVEYSLAMLSDISVTAILCDSKGDIDI